MSCVELSECTAGNTVSCFNGGSCVIDGGLPVCQCAFGGGFTGAQCQVPVAAPTVVNFTAVPAPGGSAGFGDGDMFVVTFDQATDRDGVVLTGEVCVTPCSLPQDGG